MLWLLYCNLLHGGVRFSSIKTVHAQSWHPTSKEVLRSITVYSKCITFLYLLPSFLHRVSHSFAFLPSFATQSPSLPSQALTPLSPSPPLPRPTLPPRKWPGHVTRLPDFVTVHRSREREGVGGEYDSQQRRKREGGGEFRAAEVGGGGVLRRGEADKVGGGGGWRSRLPKRQRSLKKRGGHWRCFSRC